MSKHVALDTITDEEAFTTALNVLVRTAHENGIELEGCYTCQNGSSPDWDITVTPVKKLPKTAADS